MKKIIPFTLTLLALTLCLPSLLAQKKKGKISLKAKVETKRADIQPIISTFSDSLSYALGADMQAGLKSHMMETKILIDTSQIISEYETRIYHTLTEKDINNIKSEMRLKLDSANKVNQQNTDLFMKGFALAMQNNSTDPYESGKAMGSIINMTVESYKTQFDAIGGIDNNILIFAINRGMKDQEPIIETSVHEMMEQFKASRSQEIDEETQTRIDEAKEFHAINVIKGGVVTTETGLQYKVIEKGNGKIPELSDRVTVNYEGRYIDGTVFDSTEKHGQPATFVVSQVVEGLSQALTLMPEGSKWTVYIPYDLGYGEKQVGSIKPYSTLIFDIELIKVEKDEE